MLQAVQPIMCTQCIHNNYASHTQAKATMLSQWKSTLKFEKGDESEYFQKMPSVDVCTSMCVVGVGGGFGR